jgi:hypothetical protein
VGSLIGEQATLFAVALACVRISAVLVLDDLDHGVSAAMQQTMLDALIRLAVTGPTIIVSTTDRIPVMDADVVLDLTPEQGRALWQLPAEGQQVAILRQLDPAGRQRDPRPQLNSGRFVPVVTESDADQDGANASTELYRPDSYSGLYDPESPTEYYQPMAGDPAPPAPPGTDPTSPDPTDRYSPGGSTTTGNDPTDRDRPNNPGTPTPGAPTEDNR